MAVQHCKAKCVSEFQDRLHGKGNRVMNKVSTPSGNDYRCSNCGTQTNGIVVKAKRKK